jgi:tripartite-type tricarboxylate transporter receptor subunit TctC
MGHRRKPITSTGGRAIAALLLLVPVLVSCDRGEAVTQFPSRSLTIIVPWQPGGGTDRVSRFIADQLQRELGKPVIVQNMQGGSGATGHSAGARARPDGHTLTMGTFELSTMKSMGISDLTYRDFAPLMQVNGDAAAVMVRDEAPWRTLNELLDYVRANPGTLKMSGTAAGGAWDLARSGMLLAADLPVSSVLWVPSQGSAGSIVQLLGSHIDAVCCSLPEAASQLAAGQLRALCVMSPARVPEFPNVPTAKEQGVEWEAVGWRGLLLPKRTPDAVKQVLTESLAKVLNGQPYKDFMTKAGFAIILRDPRDFERFLEEQDRQWAKVVEAAGYTGQSVVATADPGPWALPKWLAAFLVIGTAGVAGSNLLKKRGASRAAAEPHTVSEGGVVGSGKSHRGVFILLLLLPVYLFAVTWLGFFVSTFLFAFGLMVWLGTRVWAAGVLSATMLVVIHLMFVRMFDVLLPEGLWF